MLFTIRFLYVIILTTVFVSLFNCTGKKEAADKYSLYIMMDNADEYLVQTASLNGDSIDPAKSGVLTHANRLEREMIVKDGYYYSMDSRAGVFVKYVMVNKTLVKKDSVHIAELYESNYNWIHEDTLLLLGVNSDDTNVRYAKIAVSDMTVIDGTIDIQLPYGVYNTVSIGLSHLKQSKLIVGYTYHIRSEDNYITSDTAYFAVLNYADMRLLTILKDSRSTFPGSDNLIEPAFFTDEKGDFYFLTCPGVALGNNIEKPTAIFRINLSDERPDSTYFFNISTSPIQNHAYSLYYIGNGKAIIRSERKDLYKNWNEHWKVPHFEFYIVDLQKQSVEKLPLPLDKGTRRQCVINEEEVVYISLNSDTEGNNIWIYHKKDGSLSKGLSLTGETSFILRIDKLD